MTANRPDLQARLSSVRHDLAAAVKARASRVKPVTTSGQVARPACNAERGTT